MMVRRRFAAGNEFIASDAWERQISHRAAMKMSELKFANAKFASAEAMLSHCDVWPP